MLRFKRSKDFRSPLHIGRHRFRAENRIRMAKDIRALITIPRSIPPVNAVGGILDTRTDGPDRRNDYIAQQGPARSQKQTRVKSRGNRLLVCADVYRVATLPVISGNVPAVAEVRNPHLRQVKRIVTALDGVTADE